MTRRRLLGIVGTLLLFLALCAGLSLLHVGLVRDFQAFDKRESRRLLLADQKIWDLINHHGDESSNLISRLPGAELVRVPNEEDAQLAKAQTWDYHDTINDVDFKLYFYYDALRGGRNITQHHAWPYNGLWKTLEWVRLGASVIAQGFWVVLLLSCPFVWSRRRFLACLMIAAAAVCALTWSPLRGDPIAIYGNLGPTPRPRWAAPMAAAALLIFLMPHLRRSRSREPRCGRCGYNLTGNQSGICPECGTPIAELAHQDQAARLLDVQEEPAPHEPTPDEP